MFCQNTVLVCKLANPTVSPFFGWICRYTKNKFKSPFLNSGLVLEAQVAPQTGACLVVNNVVTPAIPEQVGRQTTLSAIFDDKDDTLDFLKQ